MPINKDTIKHTAHLARIELRPDELERLSGQIQDILKFIDKLKAIDVKDIPPMSHAASINNALREDLARSSLPADKALLNAPRREGNFFAVPKVIE